MNIATYSLVAYSNSGKTTFLEKLIPELKKRGLRVAVIKHDGHDFEIDKEGKDSWRISRAGADVTAIVSKTHAAVMENRPVDFAALVERIENVDVKIIEGGKHDGWRKIMLYREGAGKPMAAEPDDCFAVVTDAAVDCAAPVFGLEDAAGLAELIAKDVIL
ncbi:MAG: molybdopterin-guanine dinucleotide biosynthesis protein B [Clostridiales bacterium]|nr:molybdopterin-guanine dinucleotide biosynthesis protein B [Clostridiales bacterium]